MSALAAQNIQLALAAAARTEGGRARAIGALRGSEVYAAIWPTEVTELRTLQSSEGLRALALFSDERQLDAAARRFGWLGVDGSVPTRRMHIAEAIRFARLRRITLIVIDIASEHALELDDGDLELVAAPPSGRPPSTKDLAPVGSSTFQHAHAGEVQRVSTRPPADNDQTSQASAVAANGLRPSSVSVDREHHAVSASFAPARTATMASLPSTPTDELIAGFTHVLREYPEVEWACLVGEAERSESLSVVLRIDPAFRKNLAEIADKLHRAAADQSSTCDVLVLDTAEQIKRARAIGVPFYPWRKR